MKPEWDATGQLLATTLDAPGGTAYLYIFNLNLEVVHTWDAGCDGVALAWIPGMLAVSAISGWSPHVRHCQPCAGLSAAAYQLRLDHALAILPENCFLAQIAWSTKGFLAASMLELSLRPKNRLCVVGPAADQSGPVWHCEKVLGRVSSKSIAWNATGDRVMWLTNAMELDTFLVLNSACEQVLQYDLLPPCNAAFSPCGAFLACTAVEDPALQPFDFETLLRENTAMQLVVRLWDMRDGSLQQVLQVDMALELRQGASGAGSSQGPAPPIWQIVLALTPYKLCFSNEGGRVFVVGKSGVAVLDYGQNPATPSRADICSTVSRVTTMIQGGCRRH